MERNTISALEHRYYKVWVTILVFIMAALGIGVGIKSYGPEYIRHNVEIVSLTLSFINTALILVMVGLLLRIGQAKK